MTAADIVEAEILAEVTEPGVYELSEAEYHSDPVPGGSLSASGAKLLLPPSCPALYHYRRDHPLIKAEFDFGTAAHKYVLGQGPLVEVIDAENWRGTKAQDARREARAKGAVAMLRGELAEVEAMALAIWEHPVASALFDVAHGKPEQSLFWQDDEFGIWRRARLDWLPEPRPRPGRRMVIPDYKTTADASPAAIRKHVANYGYHMQAAQYIDGARALGIDEDPAFLFVFQEKTPPYLITIAELDDEAIRAGRERMRLACEIWRDCTQAGVWPGYSQDIELITLPPWAARTEGDY